MKTTAAAVLAMLPLASCGSEQPEAMQVRPAEATSHCARAGAHGSRKYFVCPTTTGLHNGELRVEDERNVGVLRVPLPDRDGQWKWAAVSPDGRWLLVQFAAPCETPKAFFVPTRGGRAIAAAAEDGFALESEAFGWTTDGRAIVWFPAQAACASGIGREGIYLVRPGGKPVFWRVRTPQRSLVARDVG
jgi:hypothetical protein